jgi:hypothetical protein
MILFREGTVAVAELRVSKIDVVLDLGTVYGRAVTTISLRGDHRSKFSKPTVSGRQGRGWRVDANSGGGPGCRAALSESW